MTRQNLVANRAVSEQQINGVLEKRRAIVDAVPCQWVWQDVMWVVLLLLVIPRCRDSHLSQGVAMK